MRLNLVLATFAAVSLALTGCAADFGEEPGQESLETRQGELDRSAEGAIAPIDEKQAALVDVETDSLRGALDRDAIDFERGVKGANGPRSGIDGAKARMDTVIDVTGGLQIEQDQKLKRSFGAAALAAGDVSDAPTSAGIE